MDYDYYLKMTDFLYAGDIAQVILLLNEIIAKGFDLHQFLVGLNEHFRNLLVCKNPLTIDIFEISKNIKAKYLEQAERVTSSFLMSALSIGSQLDINFKNSKNQRLHVEIGLLKLSQISAVLNLADLPEKKNSELNLSVAEQQTNTITEPHPVAVVSEPAPEIIPTVSHKTGGMKSVKDLLAKSVQEEKTVIPFVKTEEAKIEISENAIRDLIVNFFKTRGRANEQVILESGFEIADHQINFKLPNTFLISLFNEIKSDLLLHLNQSLKTSDFKINTILTAEEKAAKPHTIQQNFDLMVESNPALLKLKNAIDLDIIY